MGGIVDGYASYAEEVQGVCQVQKGNCHASYAAQTNSLRGAMGNLFYRYYGPTSY